MTSGPNFEDRLQDWLEDGPADAPRQVLDTVLAAVPSIPQRRSAWRGPWRTAPMLGFARLLAGAALTVALGAFALFVVLRPAPANVGGQGSPSPAAVVPPTAVASQPPTAPTPVPSALVLVEPCTAPSLGARITMWEGAAGHRIAHVDLKNTGSSSCTVPAVLTPQLVDGNGAVLIHGTAPSSQDLRLTVAGNATLKTLVQDGNYCGPVPVAPVSVAFVLPDGSRIIATPLSPTDATIPPCLGAGSAADIEMQPWAP